MRRRLALVVLVASTFVVVGLSWLWQLTVRIRVIAAFREFDTPMPRLTALAVHDWLLPAASTAGALCGVAALALPMAPSRRARLAATGVVVSSAALVFAALASLAPMLAP